VLSFLKGYHCHGLEKIKLPDIVVGIFLGKMSLKSYKAHPQLEAGHRTLLLPVLPICKPSLMKLKYFCTSYRRLSKEKDKLCKPQEI
jgi:hypothetical protein